MRNAFSSLTTRGRAFIAAGLTTAVCALVLGQKDLLRVAILLVALALVGAYLLNRARYRISSTRDIVPGRLQAGQPATVSIRVENRGRTPTGLMLLEDSIPYVLGGRPRFVVDQLRPKWHREMSYTVRSEVRGRYEVGPLSVRLRDPLGLVEVSRSFTSRTPLVFTPVIHQLPATSVSGDWSGRGENRPRAFAAAGTEDVTIREYRVGDDLRRIHWRSSAKMDQLMVRREEQPHQSRATVLLDTRAVAHRGTGAASSFEYAVSAAASVLTHLAPRGFVVRMLTGDRSHHESAWHDRGVTGTAEAEYMLDSLAVVQTTNRTDFDVASTDQRSPGLLVAVLGAVTRADLATLATLRQGGTRSLAILLDVEAWAGSPTEGHRFGSVEEQAALAQQQGWSVVVARPDDKMATLWQNLGRTTPTGPMPTTKATEDQTRVSA